MENQISNTRAENKIAKPFLKWAGGKTQLINEIENLLPIKQISTATPIAKIVS